MRYPGEDKVLTKTMINNYAKNDLLPPPIKKKYSKEHVLLLIFIYYYKSILSINDIQTLMKPITEKFFRNDEEFNLESIYEEIFSMDETLVNGLKEDIRREYAQASKAFGDAPEESRDFLRQFSFICQLSFDVYVKKLIIEKMVDELAGKGKRDKEEKREEKKEDKKK